MCNSASCTHDHSSDPLNDDVDDLFGGIGLDLNTTAAEREANRNRKGDLLPLPNQHVETCPACRNGTFYSWAGRSLGPCRKCKGTGKLVFKLSPEARERARKYANKAKAAKVVAAQESANQFANDNAAEYAWLTANTGKFDFATSLHTALNKYGRLTDGQLNAVRKCLLRDEERNAAREAAKVQAAASAPSCDVSKIEATFATAQSNGVKRPKMRLADFIFSLAPATGRNAGAIYVVARDSRDYLGKIQDGRFVRNTHNCTEEQAAEIAQVASDPHAAAVAYGQRFGQCSICGRELTKGESIDRMMGPICAEKYGF
jgi:hypothetical protein